MDEPSGELPSNPASLFHVRFAELSKESVVSESNTIMDDIVELKMVESAAKLPSDPGSLPHDPPAQLSKESVAARDDIVDLKMDESADELPSNPGSASHVPPPEPSKEGIAAESNSIMDDDEAKNTISMDQPTCGVQQLIDEWKHHCPKDESAGKVHSEPGSLLHVALTELSKESIVAKLKTIMDDAESTNIISMGNSAYGWRLVEELERRGEAEPSEETTSQSSKTMLDIQSATSNGQVTNALHLVEELHHQNDETGHSVPPAELSNKFFDLNVKPISECDEVESITSNGQTTHLVQLMEDTVLNIPSTEVSEKLLDNGEIENTGHAPKDPHLVGDLCPRGDEAEVCKNAAALVSETELQLGTVNRSKGLVVDEAKIAEELQKQMVDSEAHKREKTNLKWTLNKKRTEIAGELEYLEEQMDEKLKKISEMAQQEEVINTEIANMESRCSECKCRHDKFVDLFNLIVESQLPLRAHREIVLLLNKEDKEAQNFLSKALELQIQIDAQANLKLTLQEERTELAKLVELLKVQKDQKLKEANEVDKLKEAADSEITPHTVSQHTRVYSRSCRKRKTRNRQLAEELTPPEVSLKRTTLNLVGSSSQECGHNGMETDP